MEEVRKSREQHNKQGLVVEGVVEEEAVGEQHMEEPSRGMAGLHMEKE